jgi:hypothetical protein
MIGRGEEEGVFLPMASRASGHNLPVGTELRHYRIAEKTGADDYSCSAIDALELARILMGKGISPA